MSRKRREWIVPPADAGLRLDAFVHGRAPDVSRSLAARWIREGAVRVEGRAAKPALLLRAGQRVTVDVPEPRPAVLDPQPLDLQVVYEDEDLAVVNKPAGMVTHPAPGHADATLVNALLHHIRGLTGVGGVERPGIVHRLDKDTSGLLVVAKHDAVHQALSAAIAARRVIREYEAVVWGNPRERRFSITAALGRHPRDRKRFAVVSLRGREARTDALVTARYADFARLHLRLATGRTHQIRVHCQSIGHPVVGDRMYGRHGEAAVLGRLKLPRPARQLLHARRLAFVHPRSGRDCAWEVPPPLDMISFLDALGCADRRIDDGGGVC